MSRFLHFRNWAFGTNFVHLRTASNDIIPVVCRVKKNEGFYTIRYLSDLIILGPRGRFLGSHESYVHSWSLYFYTEELQAFYESEPPQATRTPEPHPLANLTPSALDWIMEKHNLQRIEDKPKTTQQEYTGKRLIQL